MSSRAELLHDEVPDMSVELKGTQSGGDELPRVEMSNKPTDSMVCEGTMSREVGLLRGGMLGDDVGLKGELSSEDELLRDGMECGGVNSLCKEMKHMEIDGGERPEKVKGTVRKKTALEKHRVRGEMIRMMRNQEADNTPAKDVIRTTRKFMKELRYEEWKRVHKWDEEDLDRILDSRDALPEMIQEYEEPMVIVGTDVNSLYPNMEVGRVVENMKEAVRTSKLEFKGVDYLEGVRYLALN